MFEKNTKLEQSIISKLGINSYKVKGLNGVELINRIKELVGLLQEKKKIENPDMDRSTGAKILQILTETERQKVFKFEKEGRRLKESLIELKEKALKEKDNKKILAFNEQISILREGIEKWTEDQSHFELEIALKHPEILEKKEDTVSNREKLKEINKDISDLLKDTSEYVSKCFAITKEQFEGLEYEEIFYLFEKIAEENKSRSSFFL